MSRLHNNLSYLLIFGGRCSDVVHEDGQQFSHSGHTSSKSPIRGSAAWLLTCLSGLIYPLACYRIYNIQNSQFVCRRCLLEVRVDFLDED